jgi:hypothetical protein
MKTIVLMLALLAPSNQAAAWEYGDFRSGMSDDQVAEAFRRQGDPVLQRVGISNIPGAYMLQSSRKESKVSLSSCKGAVYEHQTEIDGGVGRFAELVAAEGRRRGVQPNTEVLSVGVNALVISTWRHGNDEFTYLLSEDYARRVGIAEIRTDFKVKSACK